VNSDHNIFEIYRSTSNVMKSGLEKVNEIANLFYLDMDGMKFKECDSI